jgi:Family of unknown function (DUF6174)
VWTRRCVTAVSVLSLSAALACSGATEPELQFDEALARWRRSGLINYSFRSAVSCFCPVEFTLPMTVTVRNGQVVQVADRATGAARPLTYRASIDSLFAAVAREIRDRPERLQVTYDEALGFPRSLTYGTPENDGGGYIKADSVQALR